ncbi:phytoene desaturase family protein [Thermogemmatispora onikobensis]|uniref:phytoene desaturase family protein n=1 Tax=Thermogemmatispora onikobensis TaxID=732234 RepID=UPI00085294C6|nr:NAD(P)/FAD-dependent oxidoreductase [Thermogemmatispora onikobensis]
MSEHYHYDVIIIGAGHNGLVAAGYLARAGKRVLVLEQRDRVGGACTLEEPFPGFSVSPCAYVVSLLRPEIIRDLELARYGFEAYVKDPQMFVPFLDGSYLFIRASSEQTAEGIRRFSLRDAAAYPRFLRFFERASDLLTPLLLEEPPTLAELAARFRGEDEEIFSRLMFGNLYDLLAEYFESDQVRAAFAGQGVIGSFIGPKTPGSVYVMWHHMFGEVNGQRGLWGYVRGGMGRISFALAASATAHGAQIRTGAPVASVLIHNGRAEGVRLESGEELRARAVLSNADPKRTFLQLCADVGLDSGFLARIKRFRTESPVIKINLALKELPSFTCLPGSEPGLQHAGSCEISPTPDWVQQAYEDALRGELSRRPYIEAYMQSATDPSLTPPGKHLISLFCQYAPYHLKGHSWSEEVKAAMAERVIATMCEFAPNFADAIIDRQVLSPVDIEQRYGMTEGHIFHGEITPDQLFGQRPTPECARYRTPIAGLYLCGSGTHPGGGVMGAPGHNAAQALLRDWGEAS